MCVGPCLIPVETTHKYPSDSSNQLMEGKKKKPTVSMYRFFLPRSEDFMNVLL